MQVVAEIETISWRELTGNKYNRNLDIAMLSNDGCFKQQSIRRTGDSKKTIFNVVYDREYFISYVGRMICKQLFVLGKKKTLELVSEAWDYQYPNYNGVND